MPHVYADALKLQNKPKIGPAYILVMDQWKLKRNIHERKIYSLGRSRQREIAMMIRTMRICFMWSSKCLVLGLVLVKSAIAGPVDLLCPARYPDRQQWTNLQKQGWLMLSDHQGRPVLVEAGVLLGDATGNGELRGADLAMGAGRQFGFAGTETDGAK